MEKKKMMPIDIKPKETPNILTMNEDEILTGYEEKATYHFMPEFLEKVYDGPNEEILKSANSQLVEYKMNRDKYEYIGTHICSDPSEKYFIEYYYGENEELLVYLIVSPKNKKYYASLQMVSVYQKEKDNNVN
jgi:hypothetical protein